MPPSMSMGACAMSAAIREVIICTAAGRRLGSACPSPCTSVVISSAAVDNSLGAFALIVPISAVRMAAPCAIICGRFAAICMLRFCSMPGSCAPNRPIMANSCPCMLWSSMPSPATSAAMMAPMPRSLMKLPGLKKLVIRPPTAFRPDCSLGPTTPAMPPKASPMGPSAAFALPATPDAMPPSLPPNDRSPMITGFFSSENAADANPDTSLLLSVEVILPTPSEMPDPRDAIFCPILLPEIFSPANWNGKARFSAMVAPSDMNAENTDLMPSGRLLTLLVSCVTPRSPAVPSRSKKPVMESMLPPTPVNTANAPASVPIWPAMSWIVMLPSCRPAENRSIRPMALSM